MYKRKTRPGSFILVKVNNIIVSSYNMFMYILYSILYTLFIRYICKFLPNQITVGMYNVYCIIDYCTSSILYPPY